VGDVDVVLLPGEIAIDPRDVAGQCQRLRIDATLMEIAERHRLRLRHLVIDLQRPFVGADWIGRAHFEEVVRQVGQRDVLILNRLRRDVEPRARDDVAGERDARHGIPWFDRRL
jgi:hypothetical protein